MRKMTFEERVRELYWWLWDKGFYDVKISMKGKDYDEDEYYADAMICARYSFENGNEYVPGIDLFRTDPENGHRLEAMVDYVTVDYSRLKVHILNQMAHWRAFKWGDHG